MVRSKHTLPDLSYDYGALEPVISGEIMKIHHQKHHAAYVNNLNIAEEKLAEAQHKSKIPHTNKTNEIETKFQYLKDCVSSIISLAPALKFNGGGHLNHSIFWNVLCPSGTGEPTGELAEAIKRDFGSFQNMVQVLTNSSVGIQGSGWGWLGYNKQFNKLEITTCANQDPLQATTGIL